ncbi:MAG TPA: amino acid permease, partial [Steroidobacteraceae bacterium]|nr:amino acid permease [Steroidobacteraceae bacterium]
DPRMAQPYVAALGMLGVPGAGQIMNGVILTAVLSALNSGLFASSRMVMALATRGDAPAALARLNPRGVPVRAILLSTAFGYAAVIMNYVSPEHVFAFLVDSYGTVAIFVYLLIACAELRLRRQLEREAPERLRVRMWGYPGLTILAIVMMFAILAAMAFIPDQRLPLLFGVASALVMLGGYALRRGFGAASGPAPTLSSLSEP